MASTSAARPNMSTSRHHPYAPPTQHRGKYPPHPTMPEDALPRSPPRSRRDASETPPLGLGVAFGGASGGKWWDEELPAPPASLSSILDSFRRSGEGDRDLLLSILGAKKAEEERLTALIQTRLTILQARLSLHQTQASLDAAANTPSSAHSISLPVPQPQLLSPQPGAPALHPHSRRTSPSYHAEGSRIRMDKTPSLESRGSNSEASSQGAVSPREEHLAPFVSTVSDKKAGAEFDRYALSGAANGQFWGRRDNALPPIRTMKEMKEGPGPIRTRGPGSAGSRGSLSPRSNGERNGLDMLLDAGRQV